MSSLPSDSKKRKSSSSSSSSSALPITTSLLQDGLASLPSDAFWELVSSSLLPRLNSLPSSEISDIRTSFQAAIDGRRAINTIKYDQRNNEIARKLKEFSSSVDPNWKLGYEEQGEMMGDVIGMVSSWIQAVFTVCVEGKEELALGQSSLLVMGRAITSISTSRTEFSDLMPEVEINRKVPTGSNASPPIAYASSYSISDVLAKTWRDLVLVALSTGQEDLASVILGDAKRADGFAKLVRTEADVGAENKKGYPFDDACHSLEMKAALPRLRALLR